MPICGAYACDQDVYNVFGQSNVIQWSNLSGTSTTLNAQRMQTALNYADAMIQSLFRAYGNYVYPLAPTAEGIVLVNYWDSVIAGYWLYSSRGLRDGDELAQNHISPLYKAVIKDINDYRAHNLLSAALRWPQSSAPSGVIVGPL